MSKQQNSGSIETLFSLEVMIQSVRIEKEYEISGELALGVRLLDFPTLLIYQPQQRTGSGGISKGEHTFNRGKSCFFKTNVNSLYNQLSKIPLYAMVLDLKEDIPKLVGTSLISLAKVMDRIWVDVAHHGVASSSSYGERGRFSVCSLNGEKIGSISLSYKLLSLGVSLLPDATDSIDINSIRVQGKQDDCGAEMIKSTELLPPECTNDCSPTANENNFVTEDVEDSACSAIPAENFKSQSHHTEFEASLEEDLTVFCPPHLFFCNTPEEKNKKHEEAHRLLNLDSGSFTFEDTYSEEETADKVDTNSPVMKEKYEENLLRNQQTQTNDTTSNALGEALQHLPLLNALLVELSQLNNQNVQQPLPIHPNLAWIYKPASTEPSTERGTKGQQMKTEAMQKNKAQVGALFKHLHTPRTCPALVCRTECVKDRNKREQASGENKSSKTSPRKKLIYGTTRAFQLRLKKVSHVQENHRECVELRISKGQPSVEKRTIKSSQKALMSGRRKLAPMQHESFNDNIKTVMQSAALGETVTLKQRQAWEKDDRKDRCSSGVSDKSASDGDLTVINVDVDTAERNITNENHSNMIKTPSAWQGRKIHSAATSSRSNPSSAFSGSSVEEKEVADYSDDFNSLHPSDGHSPDLASSPESSRAKTPMSPLRPDTCHSDSGSECFRTRPALPVPIKSSGSPRRSLSSMYVIRPRTTTSALSLSSDDDKVERSMSSQTRTSSRRKKLGPSSDHTDSITSSRGQNSKSSENNNPIQGLSAESQSSLEAGEVEEAQELQDDLGTLDFRREYQNITDLLASNLPGYTI